MGYIEPIPIYFPTYNEEDLRQILARNQANSKLYSSFLNPSEMAKGKRKLKNRNYSLKDLEVIREAISNISCITSVTKDSIGRVVQEEDSLEVEGQNNPLMSGVLLQLSSLCNANFIVKGATCPLEGSIRYRSMASEDLALKVAKSVKFPLATSIGDDAMERDLVITLESLNRKRTWI